MLLAEYHNHFLGKGIVLLHIALYAHTIACNSICETNCFNVRYLWQLNMSFETMNNSFLSTNATTYLQYFHFHDQLYDNIPAKIIYVFLLFTIHILGPILLSGIIIFERNGGDPQKRNVINRLFSKSDLTLSCNIVL